MAAHEAQLLPVPLRARLPPLLLLLMAEKREMARDVLALPHFSQVAGVSALLMGRSFSNLSPQAAQLYSYRGMSLTPVHRIWLTDGLIVQCFRDSVKR